MILAALLVASLATIGPGATPPPAATAQPAAPTTAEAATRLARSGRHGEALAAFQALAAKDAEDFDSRVWIGRLLTWLGRRTEAVAVYQDVIARAPRHVDARVGLGATLLQLGRLDDAMAVTADAEALAPRSGDVLGLKGRLLRRLGRLGEALAALDAAHAASPDDGDIAIVRERTRRIVAHRAQISVARESSDDAIPEASIVDATLDVRLDDALRVFGRVQWQDRDGAADTRAGLGAETRLGRSVVARGAFLASPGSPRVAQADAAAELEFVRGRAQPAIGVRYLHFAAARVWIVAPSVSLDLSDAVSVALRYYRSESEFLLAGRRAGNNSAAILGRWQAGRRVGFSGAYARGNESFDILSIDRLGRFRADTLAGGLRVDLKSLTAVAVGVERQWRSGDRQLTRVTFDLIQHF